MSDRLILPVRYDDLDTNGHVRGPAYLAYADHARWQLVRAAGVRFDALAAAGLGPVNPETTVRFRRELRAEDEVAITTAFTNGKRTGEVRQLLRRTSDETIVAEVHSVSGMLDLHTRRLLDHPAERWRPYVTNPDPLGL